MSPSSTDSISQMESSHKNQEKISTKDIHHIFSIILTTSLLASLYLPRPLASFLISPSFLSSLLLIFSLFRFGSTPSQPNPQPKTNHSLPPHETIEEIKDVTPTETCWRSMISDQQFFDFARPLDIIYEEYEGEETESENSIEEKDSEISKEDNGFERWLEYAMWLSDDDDKKQEIEEDDQLIEFSFGDEEDNLIELDLSRYQIEDIKQEKVVGF
ncbi:hypothetical protein FCM35_KLT15088 [Carex littledalei]|uniref:Transmembrane protein n=1 Tax=Carex littledalei TaxID=544730 RepID=A0A833VDN9_9POAL|nr:hypothetical protein FCM35_KLT15088 [Carex littledalei]